MLIKIGGCFVDPLEIAMIVADHDTQVGALPVPHICVHLRHGSSTWIQATMDEAEAALIDAGVIEDPAGDEPPELTEEETSELTALLDAGYEWLARDGDGKLFAYASKPKRVGVFWETEADRLQPQRVKAPMDFIDAADEEPWSIGFLLVG